MRVLIAGAGIAGLTLSALLRQKGIKPQIVDRTSDFAQAPRKSRRASASRFNLPDRGRPARIWFMNGRDARGPLESLPRSRCGLLCCLDQRLDVLLRELDEIRIGLARDLGLARALAAQP